MIGRESEILVDSQAIGRLVTGEFHPETMDLSDDVADSKIRWCETVGSHIAAIHSMAFSQKAV